jgi:hypothetical protein
MRVWKARCARAGSLASLLLVGVALFGAQSALADTATITFTDTAGNSDPAASLGRVFTVAGATAVPETLYVKYRATGGAPCAPSASVDTGTESNFEYGDHSPNGNFSYAHAVTWDQGAGTYLFCIWLASSASAVATPISQVITFRGPTGTISATLSPSAPIPAQPVTITVTGSSEAPEYAFVAYNAAGVPCAATYDSDTGSEIDDGSQANGAFSFTYTKVFTAGSYILCVWLANSSTTTTPIAGPQSIPFTVATPPPPPKPHLPPATLLATHVRSIFPKVVHNLKMTVWSQVTATGQTPQGSCWLQVYTSHQWRTAGAHTPVAAKGICQIFTRFTYAGGKRFRVSFRPAAGFKQAFGASAWVIARKQ